MIGSIRGLPAAWRYQRTIDPCRLAVRTSHRPWSRKSDVLAPGAKSRHTGSRESLNAGTWLRRSEQSPRIVDLKVVKVLHKLNVLVHPRVCGVNL